jgi:hypothetical protein
LAVGAVLFRAGRIVGLDAALGIFFKRAFRQQGSPMTTAIHPSPN